MVVRLFPLAITDDAVRREAVVQQELAAAGFPTPRVTHFDPHARIDGRRYFVMERMAGKPLMGGIRASMLLRDGPGLLRRLARVGLPGHSRRQVRVARPTGDRLRIDSSSAQKFTLLLDQCSAS